MTLGVYSGGPVDVVFSYPDTPLSEFKEVDTYVCAHGGVEGLDDDEDDENDT
jgi:hypothetical protein